MSMRSESNAEPLRAAISAATSGANTIVAAVSGKRIRVLSYAFAVASEVNANWESGTTDISGVMDFGGTGQAAGMVVPHSPVGWLQTATGEALGLTLSGAVQVSGFIVYQLV